MAAAHNPPQRSASLGVPRISEKLSPYARVQRGGGGPSDPHNHVERGVRKAGSERERVWACHVNVRV